LLALITPKQKSVLTVYLWANLLLKDWLIIEILHKNYMQYKNYKSFLEDLEKKPELQQQIAANPVSILKTVDLQNEVPDTRVYRMIVASLIVAVLVIIIGILIMVLKDKVKDNDNILTIFTAISSTAIGALAGVLMPSRNQNPQ
jgi:hypothetical protein